MEVFNHLLFGGAILGFLAASWNYIKIITWKIITIFIQQIEITDELTAWCVTAYLIKNYKRSKLYDKTYSGKQEYLQSGNYGLVTFEEFGKKNIIFWSWCVPFIYNGPEKQQSGTGNTPTTSNGDNKAKAFAYITFARGTLDVDKIIKNATKEHNERNWYALSSNTSRQKRFFIKHIPDIKSDKGTINQNSSWWWREPNRRLVSHSTDEVGLKARDNLSALDHLIFPQKVKDLITEIKLWRKHKEWYQKRCIPWKRGFLLFGAPGTGKSALARAFAEDLDLPIFVFNLSEIYNHELMREWLNMQQYTPCIALIEDIDNVFHGRKNVAASGSMGFMSAFHRRERKDKSKNNSDSSSGDKNNQDNDERWGGALNFDVFLNCLDGVERSDGVFSIVTTNDITKVDPALGQPRTLPDGTIEFISTRPGRIDKAIHLTYMEFSDKKIMADRILGEYEFAHQEMLEFLEKFPDLKETPAQFQERCAQIALKCFWAQQEFVGPVQEKSKKQIITSNNSLVWAEMYEKWNENSAREAFKKGIPIEPSGYGITDTTPCRPVETDDE